MSPKTTDKNGDCEVVVELKNGCSIRSGSVTHEAGDYVRVCDPSGEEIQYWDHLEWVEDPIGVMGAILIVAIDGEGAELYPNGG